MQLRRNDHYGRSRKTLSERDSAKAPVGLVSEASISTETVCFRFHPLRNTGRLQVARLSNIPPTPKFFEKIYQKIEAQQTGLSMDFLLKLEKDNA